MSFLKKDKPTEKLEAVDSDDAPWLAAQRQHENTFLRLAAQVANWRRFAFIMAGISIMAVAGVIWIGSQSKFIPYLVEVDKLGRTLAVRALSENDILRNANGQIYREIFEMVENLRTVTTDRNANNDRLTKGFSRLTGSALAYVKQELKKAPPNTVGQSKTVQVQVKTALRLSDKSYQVEWQEHSYNLAGELLAVDNWKATLSYELVLSGDDPEVIRKNPIGFTTYEMNWMKVI